MKTGLLLSGGMDSLCVAWWLRPAVGITIDYGQLPAEAEVDTSRVLCERLEIEHCVIRVDCRSLGSGDLAGASANRHAPATDWWPFRNQMLVTFAAMKAVSLGVQELMVGTVSSDSSHQDGSLEFIEMMSELLSLQEGGIKLRAPAIGMTTAELVRKTETPLSMLGWAHSCHKANVACGSCRGCNKYYEVWMELDGRLG